MVDLPSTLVDALKAREAIPFAGAGVSRAVTDEARRPLFPTWRGLLLAASDRLGADHQTAKANRVKATMEDTDDPDAYLEAAKVARDALGALWFPFLKAQFDPPAEHVRPASHDVARQFQGDLAQAYVWEWLADFEVSNALRAVRGSTIRHISVRRCASCRFPTTGSASSGFVVLGMCRPDPLFPLAAKPFRYQRGAPRHQRCELTNSRERAGIMALYDRGFTAQSS